MVVVADVGGVGLVDVQYTMFVYYSFLVRGYLETPWANCLLCCTVLPDLCMTTVCALERSMYVLM